MKEIPNLLDIIRKELNKPEQSRNYDIIFKVIDTVEIESRVALQELNTDFLTGLGNDRSMSELLENLEVGHKNVAIAAMDISGLKMINDIYGRSYGDKLILAASDYLIKSKRENDIIIRAGTKADEFYIVSLNMVEDNEKRFLERLVNECTNVGVQLKYMQGKAKIPLRFSYGYSINDGKTSLQETKFEAEQRLNQNKEMLKRRVYIINSKEN